jgi:cell division transport system permease protein
MKIETMKRHVREAYRAIRRNAWMSLAAISVVSVTLIIFGIFLAVMFNIRYMSSELDKQVAVRVVLDSQLTADQEEELTKQIKNMPDVKDATFVPKEEGLKKFKAEYGENADELFKDLEGENNPLPDVIEVLPKDPKKIQDLADNIKKIGHGVQEVRYAKEVTDRLFNLTSKLQTLVLICALGLGILSAFLISNTIKLTIIARKREIEIQRLVGASNWFIRWPFFFEGAFIGLIGAIFPTIFVLVFYQIVYIVMGQDNILKMMPTLSLSLYVTLCLFVLGVAIGVWGSFISVRRFLKI